MTGDEKVRDWILEKWPALPVMDSNSADEYVYIVWDMYVWRCEYGL